MQKIAVLGFVISVASTDLHAQIFYHRDSSAVSKIASEFFQWYIAAIKEHQYAQFQPRFVETDTGMTTLDFSQYVANLRKYNWSEEFIDREVNSYQECMRNLAQVKFSEFGKTKFTDLDADEQAKCDFGNSYKWIGGQELIDGVRISEVIFVPARRTPVRKRYFRVTLEKFNYGKTKNDLYHHGDIQVFLLKVKGLWKIDGIKAGERVLGKE